MIKRKPIIALIGVMVLIAALTAAAAPQDSQTTNSSWDQNYPMMKGGMGMMGPGMMGKGMMGPGMMGRGMMGPGMMGKGMMGPGMMGKGMMGPGMMGSGMMRDCMMGYRRGPWTESPWSDLNYNSRGELLEPLSKKKAEEIAQFYLDRLGNPRLKSGQIKERDNVFEAAIITRDDSLVDKLLVEKDTGVFYLARD